MILRAVEFPTNSKVTNGSETKNSKAPCDFQHRLGDFTEVVSSRYYDRHARCCRLYRSTRKDPSIWWNWGVLRKRSIQQSLQSPTFHDSPSEVVGVSIRFHRHFLPLLASPSSLPRRH